jgi:hypothetical protein
MIINDKIASHAEFIMSAPRIKAVSTKTWNDSVIAAVVDELREGETADQVARAECCSQWIPNPSRSSAMLQNFVEFVQRSPLRPSNLFIQLIRQRPSVSFCRLEIQSRRWRC